MALVSKRSSNNMCKKTGHCNESAQDIFSRDTSKLYPKTELASIWQLNNYRSLSDQL